LRLASLVLAIKEDIAMDQGLFALNGTTYKDLSSSAAAQRAAYFDAQFLEDHARLVTPSGGVLTQRQTLSRLGSSAAFTRFDNFTNYGTAPDYTAEGGTQGPGQEGWNMHSLGTGNTASRLRFNLLFNVDSAPSTYIRVSMRGAPDNGKVSYVTLREQRCVDDPNQSECDEVDLVEYYGYSTDHRAEWTIFQNSVKDSVAHARWPAPTDAGFEAYSYSVYLQKGNYIKLAFFRSDGLQLDSWERHSNDGYVPTQPMYLYVGIWDCQVPDDRDPQREFCVANPGHFTGESFCSIQWIYVNTESPT
jgi:hypothetical protein